MILILMVLGPQVDEIFGGIYLPRGKLAVLTPEEIYGQVGPLAQLVLK